jgi:hypothetical protein
LSESTANQDKIEKKQIYQDKLRVNEYFWYDPFNPEDLAGFVLVDGLYEPIQPNEQGWLISNRLGLALVRWQGDYKGVTAVWIRWATLEGVILPTPQEVAQEAQQKAEEAQQKAERLAAKLRELGINPESV